MAFRYTPTPTPSISPTISLTPSITPTMTPTGTACPGLTPTATSNTPTPTQTPTITPSRSTPTPTPTNTPTPTFTSYIYAGTANTYASDTLACSNKNCARPYYKSIPSWAVSTIVYDDSGLTTPFNGGGNWIAVDTATGAYCSGSGWAAIQVDSSGVILNFVSCP